MASFDKNTLYPRCLELEDFRELKIYQAEFGDVGCVVWDAAIALSKFLECLVFGKLDSQVLDKYLELKPTVTDVLETVKRCTTRCGTILELGSGTGCVGLVAAALGCDVTITDLPEFVELMHHNVKQNKHLIAEMSGRCGVTALDWGSDVHDLDRPDLIVLADCIYYEKADHLVPSYIHHSAEHVCVFFIFKTFRKKSYEIVRE